jgi:hypothetical protein
MRPAEVAATLRRPTLTSEWLSPMPRLERASSKNRRSRPRAAQAPAAPAVHEHKLKANDYTLGALDFGQFKVRRLWPDENFHDWMAVVMQVYTHFAIEEAKTGQRVLQKVGVPYIMRCKPPPGREMSEHLAKAIFTICREGLAMKGGRPPNKQNKTS